MIRLKLGRLAAGILISGLVCFLCLWQIGATSISISDESLHVKVTQEIFQKGNWWSPTLSGMPYYSKPPFKMWLACLPLYLLGESNFSYRVLDGLLGIASCLTLSLLVWQLFRSFWGALLSPLALLSNYQYVFGAHGVRRATQDPMLVFLTLVVFLLGWLWWQKRDVSSVRYALGLGLCTACAVLTKSIAGAIPLALVVIFYLSGPEGLEFVKKNKLALGLCLISAIVPVASYYLPHFLLTDGYYHLAVESELVDRVQTGYHNSGKPAYYVRQILQGSFGPIGALLAGLGAFWATKFWRRDQGRFLLITLSVPLSVFSIIPSRLAWYLSSSYPSLAIISLFPWMVALEPHSQRKKLLIFLRGLTLLVICYHLSGFVARAIRPMQRSAFDLSLESVRKAGDIPLFVHGPGLRMDQPHHNRVEKIYLATLKERLHVFSALDQLPSNQAAFVVLLPSNESEKLLKTRSPASFAKLPHARHNKPPLMLLAFGARLEGAGFKQSKEKQSKEKQSKEKQSPELPVPPA